MCWSHEDATDPTTIQPPAPGPRRARRPCQAGRGSLGLSRRATGCPRHRPQPHLPPAWSRTGEGHGRGRGEPDAAGRFLHRPGRCLRLRQVHPAAVRGRAGRPVVGHREPAGDDDEPAAPTRGGPIPSRPRRLRLPGRQPRHLTVRPRQRGPAWPAPSPSPTAPGGHPGPGARGAGHADPAPAPRDERR